MANEYNKTDKALFPPIVNTLLNKASGASEKIQQAENTQRAMEAAVNPPQSNISRGSILMNTMTSPNTTKNNSKPASNVPRNTSGTNIPQKNNTTKGTEMSNSMVSRRSGNVPMTGERNSMSTAASELMGKLTSVPKNNSVGGGMMNSSQEEVGPKELNALVDVIMQSDLERPSKRQLLKVILNNIKTITDREDKEINDMKDKYVAGAYMSALMPQAQSQFGSMYSGSMMPMHQPAMQYPPYMMPPPPYGTGMMNPMSMPYYMGAQQPNMQVEMLGNKINVLQMEMADLTRHLKDYTRRYMDVMREDDMQRIKTYIEELSNVKGTVEEAKQIANVMTPPVEEEDESEKKGLIDKATDTVKSGLATVTSAMNNIGSRLGLVKEENTSEAAAAAPTGNNTTPKPPAPSNTAPPTQITKPPNTTPPSTATPEPDSEGENMVNLSDYEVSTDDETKPIESEDDLDAAIDQLNEASSEALDGGRTQPPAAQPPAQPATPSVNVSNNKSRNQNKAVAAKPANTVNALAKPANTVNALAKPANTANALAKPANTANALAKPANTVAAAKPANTVAAAKPANTANALAKMQPAKTPMTGGGYDFFKTFKNILSSGKSRTAKKARSKRTK